MEEREALKREIEVLQGNVLIGLVRNPESCILVPVSFRFSLFYECAVSHDSSSPHSSQRRFPPVYIMIKLIQKGSQCLYSLPVVVQRQQNFEACGFRTVMLLFVFFTSYFYHFVRTRKVLNAFFWSFGKTLRMCQDQRLVTCQRPVIAPWSKPFVWSLKRLLIIKQATSSRSRSRCSMWARQVWFSHCPLN